MDLTVTLYDIEGDLVEMPNCSCGSPADTFMTGISLRIWKCNKCLYGDSPEAKFIYKEIL